MIFPPASTSFSQKDYCAITAQSHQSIFYASLVFKVSDFAGREAGYSSRNEQKQESLTKPAEPVLTIARFM
ncbi:hypothetical protein HYU19_03930 [Candidatus Woesearchaeota archaeon]|nr:hypothetical protein [Candidatus Woesearchaeota archaeon]